MHRLWKRTTKSKVPKAAKSHRYLSFDPCLEHCTETSNDNEAMDTYRMFVGSEATLELLVRCYRNGSSELRSPVDYMPGQLYWCPRLQRSTCKVKTTRQCVSHIGIRFKNMIIWLLNYQNGRLPFPLHLTKTPNFAIYQKISIMQTKRMLCLEIPIPNIQEKKIWNWQSFICKDIHYSFIY